MELMDYQKATMNWMMQAGPRNLIELPQLGLGIRTAMADFVVKSPGRKALIIAPPVLHPHWVRDVEQLGGDVSNVRLISPYRFTTQIPYSEELVDWANFVLVDLLPWSRHTKSQDRMVRLLKSANQVFFYKHRSAPNLLIYDEAREIYRVPESEYF